MRLLILGMNYAPETTGIGPYTTGLAEHLAERGHKVTVATAFPHYPTWRVQPDYAARRPFMRERRRGVDVRRTWVFLPRARSALQRVLYDTSLAVTTALASLGIGRLDLVLCVTPPLQLALTALALGMAHRAPVALLVQDLVPDAAVAVGLMHEGRIVRLARRLERFVYGRADSIIVIGRGFLANLTAKGVPCEKMALIPDWVDTAQIRPLPRDNAFRTTLGLGADQFLVIHAGNMGAKQGLETLIRAAAHLRRESDIVFLLVGDGSERPQLEALAREQHLANVRFLPLQPQESVPWMFAAADLLVLVQRAAVTDAVVPSKLLSYMASGRPICVSADEASEAARAVREAGCGVTAAAEDPEALADAVRCLRADRAAHAALGNAGRRYVERSYAREAVLRQYEQHLQQVACRGPRPNSTLAPVTD